MTHGRLISADDALAPLLLSYVSVAAQLDLTDNLVTALLQYSRSIQLHAPFHSILFHSMPFQEITSRKDSTASTTVVML